MKISQKNILNNPILLAGYGVEKVEWGDFFNRVMTAIFDGFLSGLTPIEVAGTENFLAILSTVSKSDHPQAPFQRFCFDWLLKDYHANKGDYVSDSLSSTTRKRRRFKQAKNEHYETTR